MLINIIVRLVNIASGIISVFGVICIGLFEDFD